MKNVRENVELQFAHAVFKNDLVACKAIIAQQSNVLNQSVILELPPTHPLSAQVKNKNLPPLMWAIIGNANEALINFLLERGANVKTLTSDNWTVLHCLALCSKQLGKKAYNFFWKLVNKGADLAALTSDNKRVVDIANDDDFKHFLLHVNLQELISQNQPEEIKKLTSTKGFDLNSNILMAHIPEERLQSQTNDDARYRHQTTKKTLEKQLNSFSSEAKDIDKNVNQLLEIKLLAKGYTLSGFKMPTNFSSIEKIIALILQNVYKKQAAFNLLGEDNSSIPSLLNDKIQVIISSAQIDKKLPVDSTMLDQVVLAINNEYESDNLQIVVKLNQETGLIFSKTSPSIKEGALFIEVFQDGNDFFTAYMQPTYYLSKMHAKNLIQRLIFHKTLLLDLANYLLEVHLKSKLHSVSVEKILKTFENIQSLLRPVLSFKKFFDFLQTEKIENDSVFVLLSALSTLIKIEEKNILTKDENEHLFRLLKDQAILNLRLVVNNELIERKETIEREQTDDKIIAVEKKIRKRQDEIAKLEKIIDEKINKLKDLQLKYETSKKKSLAAKTSYESQLKSLDKKMEKLTYEFNRLDTEYQKLKRSDIIDQSKIKDLEKKRSDNQKKIEDLRSEKVKLESELAKVNDEILKLKHSEEDVVSELDKLNTHKRNLETQKNRYDSEKNVIGFFMDFIKRAAKAFLESEKIYSNRSAIKKKLQEFSTSSNGQFKDLYHYLIKDLRLVELTCTDIDKYADHAESYFHETIYALTEILSDPTYSYDDNTQIFVYKGVNISWDDCLNKLNKFVEDFLEVYGLAFKADILYFKYGVTKLSDLPSPLSKYLASVIRIICRPNLFEDPADEPSWKELTAQGEELRGIVDTLKITRQEIMPHLVKGIELIAGNNIIIESNITQPSINITMMANKDIFLKDNCEISTSSLSAKEFAHPKARDGDDPEYFKLKGKKHTGHAGDEGLCGLPALPAGHITVRANKAIHNLGNLKCIANGGNGAKGQVGGNGGQGVEGKDTPDANPERPGTRPGFLSSNSSALVIAEAREPGIGANGDFVEGELPKPGGDGGKAGLGGEGGYRGDIHIEDEQYTISFIGDQQPFIRGVKLDPPLLKRMPRNPGLQGADGALDAEAGRPGEVGYRGYPVAHVKSASKALLVFLRWEVNTYRFNFDMEKVRETMKMVGHSEEHWSNNFSHQYTSTQYWDLPISEDKEIRKGQDIRSRAAERKGERFGHVDRKKAIEATKNHNHAIESSYQQQLQQKANEAAELKSLIETQKRAEERNSHLNQLIEERNGQIVLDEAGIRQKTGLKNEIGNAITVKNQAKSQLNQHIQGVDNQIKGLQDKQHATAQDFIASMDHLTESSNITEQALLAKQSADIDVTAQSTAKGRFEQQYKKIEHLLLLQQQELIGAIDVENNDKKQSEQIRDELKQDLQALNAERDTLLANKDANDKEIARIERAIYELNIQQEATVDIQTVYQAAVSVDHDAIDKKSTIQQMKELDDLWLNDEQARKRKFKEIDDEMRGIMKLLGVKGEASVVQVFLAYAGIHTQKEDLTFLERFWKGEALNQIKLIKLMPRWLIAQKRFTGVEISQLWAALENIVVKELLATKENTELVDVLIQLSLSIEKISIIWLASKYISENNAKEYGLFLSAVTTILNASDIIVKPNIIDDVRFKHHFNNYFVSNDQITGDELQLTIENFPKRFNYIEKDQEISVRKFLVTICTILFAESEDQLAKKSIYEIYFNCVSPQRLEKCENLLDKLKIVFSTIDFTIYAKELSQPTIYQRLLGYYANIYAKLFENNVLIALNKHAPSLIPSAKTTVKAENKTLKLNADNAQSNRPVDLTRFVADMVDYVKVLVKLDDIELLSESLVDLVKKFISLMILKDRQSTDIFKLDILQKLNPLNHAAEYVLFDIILVSINPFILDKENAEVNQANRYMKLIKVLDENTDAMIELCVATFQESLGLHRTKSENLQKEFDQLHILVSLIREGANEVEFFKDIKLILECLTQYKADGSEENLIKKFTAFRLDKVKKIRESLLKDCGININSDISYDKIFDQFTANNSFDSLKIRKLLCCIRCGGDNGLNIDKIETTLNRLKQSIANKTLKPENDLIYAINWFDNYINEYCFQLLSKTIEGCARGIKLKLQEFDSLNEQVERFEEFFKGSYNEDSAIAVCKKKFILHLLYKLKLNNVNIANIKDLSKLIEENNKHELSRLASKPLFNYPNIKMPDKLKELIQTYQNAVSKNKIEDIFYAWFPIMEFVLSNLADFKSSGNLNDYINLVIADCKVFMAGILFEDIELQDKLHHLSFEIYNALSTISQTISFSENDKIYLEELLYITRGSAYKANLYSDALELVDFQKKRLNGLRQNANDLGQLHMRLREALAEIFMYYLYPVAVTPRVAFVEQVIKKLPGGGEIYTSPEVWSAQVNTLVQEHKNIFTIQEGDSTKQLAHAVALLSKNSVDYSQLYAYLTSGKVGLEECIRLNTELQSGHNKKGDVYLESIKLVLIRQLFTTLKYKMREVPGFVSSVEVLEMFSDSEYSYILEFIIEVALQIKDKADPKEVVLDKIIFKLMQKWHSTDNIPQYVLKQIEGYPEASSETKNHILFILVLIEFSSKKKEYIKELLLGLESKVDEINNTAELRTLTINLKVRLCQMYLYGDKISSLNVQHINTLVSNLSEIINAKGVRSQLALDLLNYLLNYLENKKASQEDDEMPSLIKSLNQANPKYLEILNPNIFNEEEMQYVNRLNPDVVNNFVLTIDQPNYLIALKKIYWKYGICRELFYQYVDKYLNDKYYRDQEGYKSHFLTLYFGDSLENIDAAYLKLVVLIGALRDKHVKGIIIDEFMSDIKIILDLKRELIISNSLALTDNNEEGWLVLIDALRQKKSEGLTLLDMTAILKYSIFFTNLDDLTNIISSRNHKNIIHAMLYKIIETSISKQVYGVELSHENHTKILLGPMFNTTNGLYLLEVLAKRLTEVSPDGSKVLSMQLYNQIVSSLSNAAAYNNPILVRKLEKLSLTYWLSVLNRQIFANMISAKIPTEKGKGSDDRPLIEDLIALEKLANPEVYRQFIELIKNADNINNTVLATICKNFVTDVWQLDQSSISMIQNEKNTDMWLIILINEFTSRQKASDEVLSTQSLITLMSSDEIQVAAGLNVLITEKVTEPLSGIQMSRLEKLVFDIKAIYVKKYSNMDENALKDEIGNKKALGSKFLDRHAAESQFLAEMVQFLALMVRVVNIVEKFTLRDTQLIALIAFITGFRPHNGQLKGRLANISTGEGKSIIASMFAITCALRGETVDVITSSMALAVPQSEELKQLVEFFGLNVSNNCDLKCEKEETERRKRYSNNQIIYGDVGSFQRDALLTEYFNKKIRPNKSDRIIIDEVDSALIDNTDKVLYISHTIHDLRYLRHALEFIWQCVHAKDTYSYSTKNVELISELFNKEIEHGVLSIPIHLKEFIDRRLPIWIKNAYLAKSMDPDQEYSIIQNGEYADKALINDLATGVEQFQSQWSNGLHQFIQLKHHKELNPESLRAVFISNVSYINRYRDTGCLNGMTGTLGGKAEQDLLAEIYGCEFFKVPRFKKNKFRKETSLIEGSEDAWRAKIVENTLAKAGHEASIDAELKATAKGIVAESMQLETKQNDQLKDLRKKHDTLQQAVTTAEKAISELDEAIKNAGIKMSEMKDNSASNLRDQRMADDKKRKDIQDKMEVDKKSLSVIDIELAKLESDIKATRSKRENSEAIINDKTGRAVLIICEDKQVAKILKSQIHHRLKSASDEEKKRFSLEKNNLYSYDSYIDGLHMKTEQVQPGDIIVATNIGGRGTDLEISKQLEARGGIHVILSYIPKNVRIELQAFGRTARKGLPGTGSFIVYDQRHTNDFYLPIQVLIDERDEFERVRLNKIIQIKLPRMKVENRLMEMFSQLQIKITESLKNRSVDDAEIELQIKSLRNRWAFWFDEHDSMINDVHKDTDKPILEKFEIFTKTVLALIDNHPDMLIHEPAEYMALANQLVKREDYHRAFRYYEKAIDANPHFSGFMHYYYAQALLSADTRQFKSLARKHLKLAVQQFKLQIERLSTSNQIIEVVKQRMLSEQKRLSSDVFTKTNIDEIGMYNIHIGACKKAIGQELTLDSMKTGVFGTESEQAKIFDRMRKHLPKRIKDYRVSQKAFVREGKVLGEKDLYYKEKLITIPSQFEYCKKEFVEYFSQLAVSLPDQKRSYQERLVNKEKLQKMLLTADEFIATLRAVIDDVPFISPSVTMPEMLKGNSQWTATEYQEHGLKVKEIVSSLKAEESKDDLQDKLKKAIGNQNFDFEKIFNKLINDKIIEQKVRYSIKKESRVVIDEYFQTIELSDSVTPEQINKLPFERIPELHSYSKLLKDVLSSLCTKEKRLFTLGEMSEGKMQDVFKEGLMPGLFKILKAYNLVKNGLLDKLKINTSNLEPHKRLQIEDTLLLAVGETRYFTPESLFLVEDPAKYIETLLSQLEYAGFIKYPTIRFANTEKSGPIIDAEASNLEAYVRKYIYAIRDITEPVKQKKSTKEEQEAEDKRDKQARDHLAASIIEILMGALGSLRTIDRVELKNYNIEEYFRNRQLPPIIVKYMQDGFADVLNIIEKQDKGSDWDAYVVAVFGVVQIVVGVLIIVYAPEFSYIGEELISQGIGDLVFAITAMEQGNFSWEAYGQHKAQSVALSILSIGVGSLLEKYKSAEELEKIRQAREASKHITIASRIGVELLKAGFQVMLNIGINKAMTNIAREIMSGLLDDFKLHFAVNTKNRIVVTEIQRHMVSLYNKLGINEARIVIDRVFNEVEFNRVLHTEVNIFAQQAAKIAASRISQINGASGSETLLAIVEYSKWVVTILALAEYAKKIADIESLTEKFFSKISAELRKRNEKYAQESAKISLTDAELNKLAEDKLDLEIDKVVRNVVTLVEQIFHMGGSQLMHLAFAGVTESVNRAIEETVTVYRDTPALVSAEAQQAAEGANARSDIQQKNSEPAKEGTIENAEQLQERGIESIETPVGEVPLTDVLEVMDPGSVKFIKKDGKYCLATESYSNGFSNSSSECIDYYSTVDEQQLNNKELQNVLGNESSNNLPPDESRRDKTPGKRGDIVNDAKEIGKSILSEGTKKAISAAPKAALKWLDKQKEKFETAAEELGNANEPKLKEYALKQAKFLGDVKKILKAGGVVYVALTKDNEEIMTELAKNGVKFVLSDGPKALAGYVSKVVIPGAGNALAGLAKPLNLIGNVGGAALQWGVSSDAGEARLHALNQATGTPLDLIYNSWERADKFNEISRDEDRERHFLQPGHSPVEELLQRGADRVKNYGKPVIEQASKTQMNPRGLITPPLGLSPEEFDASVQRYRIYKELNRKDYNQVLQQGRSPFFEQLQQDAARFRNYGKPTPDQASKHPMGVMKK